MDNNHAKVIEELEAWLSNAEIAAEELQLPDIKEAMRTVQDALNAIKRKHLVDAK